jgi:hypothetical protein
MAILTNVQTPWQAKPVKAYVKLIPIMRGDELEGVRQLIYRDAASRKSSSQPLEMRPLGREIVQAWKETWAKELAAEGMTPCKLTYAKVKDVDEFKSAVDC